MATLSAERACKTKYSLRFKKQCDCDEGKKRLYKKITLQSLCMKTEKKEEPAKEKPTQTPKPKETKKEEAKK